MLSTLLSATVPAEDAELLQRLTDELDQLKGETYVRIFPVEPFLAKAP